MRGGEAVFLRALDPAPEEKGEHLGRLIAELRSEDGASEDGQTFEVEPDEFEVVPGSPFAYWVGEPIRRIFREFPPLEGNVGTVQHGASTKDDFRFLRLWWEVDPGRLGYSIADTKEGQPWIHFAKGGSYSPYYADVHLVVNWGEDAAEIEASVLQKYSYLKGNAEWVLHRGNDYFRPGLTWPRRTTSQLSMRRLPSGSIFADKGPVILIPQDDRGELSGLQAVLQSSTALYLIETMLAAATAAARSYEVGVLQSLPIRMPQIEDSGFISLVEEAFELARAKDVTSENSHAFMRPLLLVRSNSSLEQALGDVDRVVRERTEQLESVRTRLDQEVARLYGLDGPGAVKGAGRNPANETQPTHEGENDDPEQDHPENAAQWIASLLSWTVGVALGRWDVRMAQDSSLLPDLQDAFDRLPRLAPATLVGPDGYAASRESIASEAWSRARSDVISLPEPASVDGPDSITAGVYPIEVAWNGVLVDDPDHEWDIVRKVREVLGYVYGDQARQVEEDALQILRAGGRTPRTLRDWFRNRKATALGKSFFDFHVSQYSKSRRKAPIYWRLCTSPGRGQSEYGIWLYYHRLTDDTLWTVLNEYVGPKLELEEGRLEELRERARAAQGADRRRTEGEVEEKQSLLEELRWFDGELRKVAERGYAPDLDDGVVINMAPLHPVVPWNEPEKIWKRLEKGEYDWATMAIKHWPERVREKCEEDRSLAIAHGASEGQPS